MSLWHWRPVRRLADLVRGRQVLIGSVPPSLGFAKAVYVRTRSSAGGRWHHFVLDDPRRFSLKMTSDEVRRHVRIECGDETRVWRAFDLGRRKRGQWIRGEAIAAEDGSRVVRLTEWVRQAKADRAREGCR